jgi:hypothetical protein
MWNSEAQTLAGNLSNLQEHRPPPNMGHIKNKLDDLK